jgi:hypothetical protein
MGELLAVMREKTSFSAKNSRNLRSLKCLYIDTASKGWAVLRCAIYRKRIFAGNAGPAFFGGLELIWLLHVSLKRSWASGQLLECEWTAGAARRIPLKNLFCSVERK